MWVAYAFASALFAGITAVLAKIGLQDSDSDVVTALRTGVVLLFAWLMAVISGEAAAVGAISAKGSLFLVLSGLATGGSWLCYFKALRLGDINKVTPIDKSSTVLTMLLAMTFLGEGWTLQKAGCMILIAAGTYLMIEKKDLSGVNEGQGLRHGWFLYAVLSAVFASLTAVLGKIGVSQIPSDLATAIRTSVVLVMAWLIVVIRRKTRLVRKVSPRSMLFVFLSGIATGLSWLCYYKALRDGDASIIAPIDKLSILISIAFAAWILKEKMRPKAVAGLFLLTAGTLLLLL